MNRKFSGTGVALVTPFNSHGMIDFPAVERLVEHVISNGINYLVVLGTTGESVTLSAEEKKELTSFIIKTNAGRLPIVLGIGGNNTAEVVKSLKQGDFDGIDAILSVSPYYNKPNQEGIYLHYKAVAENSPLPIILYNVPGRTGSNISCGTVIRLAKDFQNIIAVKEASGNLSQIMDIIHAKPENFMVISGDDNLTFPMICLGASGVISVVANVYPKQFSDMVQKSLTNELAPARDIHYQLKDFTDLLFADGSPGGAKAALEVMGICSQFVRLPLAPVNQKIYQEIGDFVLKNQ
jgi:4-hydroxy-tetrahydrodipicolinate synthase